MLLLLGLAVASRAGSSSTRDSVPFDPTPTTASVVLGVVTTQSPADRELLAGLRAWAGTLPDTGIEYKPAVRVRRVLVRLVTASADGAPEGAAAAARQLLARGVKVLVAPVEPAALASVARVARARRALLFSLGRPPGRAAPARTTTWLAQPQPDRLDGTLALGAIRSPGGAGGRRLAILCSPARRPRCAASAAAARARGSSVRVLDVGRGGLEAALAQVRADRPDMIVVQAPPGMAKRWFGHGAAARVKAPWVLVADDAVIAARALRSTRIAAEVPWSPEGSSGGFLGLAISAMVVEGRSSDPSRLLRARDAMRVPTRWGVLAAHRGELASPPSQLVLLDHGAVRPLWPPRRAGTPLLSALQLRSSTPVAR